MQHEPYIIPLPTREEREQRAPVYSDEALALTYAGRLQDHLRYVATWGKWLIWGEKRWRFDDTLSAFDLARDICRKAAAKCNDGRTSKALTSAHTVAAVHTLARADRRIAATTDQWDTDPSLLNTPGGTIDLKTGETRPHARADYITRITAVSPEGKCPQWQEFLKRITDDNVDLIAFLQCACGYGLTGWTKEHAMFFLYGTGANGKSVFLNTISRIFADYHKVAPIETFTHSRTERHPTDLASLRGARLVTAVETEEGRRWAESRIKALTGGDAIAARFMRQDFFEFEPQFKLMIAGNHKPGLRSVDEAIRRRFHLIPFATTIPEDERDEALTEKLEDEWPGILQWMIEGCLDWQARGLNAPEIVRTATDEYLESQDAIASWIDECCEGDRDDFETRTDLFNSWSTWADKAGEHVGARTRFLDNLETRGLHTHKTMGQRGFKGLRIKGPDLSGENWNK